MSNTEKNYRSAKHSTGKITPDCESVQLPIYNQFLEDAQDNSSCLDASCATVLEVITFLLVLDVGDCVQANQKQQIMDFCKGLALINRDLTDIKREYLKMEDAV